MRKQEQRLRDAIRSMDRKKAKPIQKREHLSAFERKLRNAKKTFA